MVQNIFNLFFVKTISYQRQLLCNSHRFCYVNRSHSVYHNSFFYYSYLLSKRRHDFRILALCCRMAKFIPCMVAEYVLFGGGNKGLTVKSPIFFLSFFLLRLSILFFINALIKNKGIPKTSVIPEKSRVFGGFRHGCWRVKGIRF